MTNQALRDILHDTILGVLEAYDGTCFDVVYEREAIAAILTVEVCAALSLIRPCPNHTNGTKLAQVVHDHLVAEGLVE